VYKFSIDYARNVSSSPFNNEYLLTFGNSIFVAPGASSWKFPGLQIVEVDNNQNRFGSMLLNRGLVMYGPSSQGYPILTSLVMWNGDQTGADGGSFWGELAMYSPQSPYNQTVYLASGQSGTLPGNPVFRMWDVNKNVHFQIDNAGNCQVYGVLQGIPTSGGAQTPVTVYALNLGTAAGGATVPVIRSDGIYLGPGALCGVGGIQCGGVNPLAKQYTSSGQPANTNLQYYGQNIGTTGYQAKWVSGGPAGGRGIVAQVNIGGTWYQVVFGTVTGAGSDQSYSSILVAGGLIVGLQ
jgi:hypothetical protein